MVGFLVKEIRELIRTRKAIVLLAILVVFGLASPILARMMPELVDAMLSSVPGAVFTLPEPTAFDAYQQFFKNLYQIGMVVVILIAMGAVVEEKTSRALALVLTRPVSRPAVLLAKYTAHAALVTVGVILAAIGCAVYTRILFDDALLARFIPALLLLIADTWLLLAVVILWSTISSRLVFAALGSFGVYLALSALGFVFQTRGSVVPGQNAGLAGFLITGGRTFTEVLPAIAISVVGAGLILGVAIVVFRRQEI